MAHLRAVGPDDVPVAPPLTLVEATERSRREFLVRSRLQIATVIDAGVPAHALGRLIAEMDRIDGEVRRLDVLDEKEFRRAAVTDEAFNAAAL